MSKRILYGPDDRPVSMSNIENEAAALRARYPGGLVTSMFPGAHPFDAGEHVEAQMMSAFIKPRDVDTEFADFASEITSNPGVYNERFARRNPIADLNKPKDIEGVFSQCMRFYEDNYIVNRAINIKKNFATKDMTIKAKGDAVKAFYEGEFRRLKIRQLLGHIFRYYYMCGRVVVYWGYERPVTGVCLLDPRRIIVRRFLNTQHVFLKPDPRWVSVLTTGDRYSTPESRFLKQNLPKQWIRYILKNQEIPLDDNTFALVENNLPLFNQRGTGERTVEGVPLSAAFDALNTHKMLVAGDFSTAWMIKNLIALISIGDPKAEGERYVPPDQIALQKLEACFQRPEYAMIAYVDPTVNIRYIYPDPKIMDVAKYAQSEKQIEHVLGVPGCFTSATQDFASAQLSVKPFREDIGNSRQDVVEQFFWKFLPIMKEGYTAKKAGGKEIPELDFDNDCLVDDKVIQDKLSGQWDRGTISNRSLLEGKAQDFDTEVERKQDEQKHKDLLQPLYDAHHGPVEDEGGRPNASGKSSSEGRNTHQPRPSRPTS